MKRRISILLVCMVMVMTSIPLFAMAEATTIAGTPRSQTLVVDPLDGKIGNPYQCNPYMTGTNFSSGLHQLVYSNLWEINTITGEQFCDLASTFPEPLNDDYTSFRIGIREGLKWSDGEVFDANDVVFTINTLLEKKADIPTGASMATYIKDVELVNDYEIIINTLESYPKLSQTMGVTVWGNAFRVIPEHIFSKTDILTDPYENPVSIGPYVLIDRDPQGYWFLYQKREDWQFSDVGAISGEPHAEYVLFQSFGTEDKRVMAMLNNDIDILCDITPESWEVLQMGNEHVQTWLDEYPFGCFDDPCERGILFNCAVDPFSSKDVRWGMALALDIVQVSMDTFNGQMRVSPLQMPPTTFMMENIHMPLRDWLVDYAFEDGYQPFDKDFALNIAEVLKEEEIEGLPESEEALVELFGIGWWKHDPEKATELLEKAGLAKDASGTWTYNGEVLSFEIIAPADFEMQSNRLAYACAEQWRNFGFDVTVQPADASIFQTSGNMGEFSLGSYWPACGVQLDFYGNLSGWHKDLVSPIGQISAGVEAHIKSDLISDVLDKMSVLPSDDEQIRDLAHEMMKAFVEDVAWLPMFGTTKLVPVNNYYWTNYVSASNTYDGPWWWWSCFKFQLPQITSTAK